MDRRDFYFKMLVSEGDMDEAFDLVEQADRNLVIDGGLVGVYTGLAVAEAGVPNLTVQVSGGAAYDQTGQRTAVVGAQIVPVNVDKDNVSTEVAGVGNSKIISVFIKFKRVLSNPKNDGNNVVVQYNRNESFEFIVEQSDEGVSPTAPSLKADALLLADIERAFGQTTIVDANINTDRRQWAINVEAGDFSIGAGRIEEAFQAVVTQFDSLEGDLGGNGGAAMIGYNGGPAWADGTTNPATTVEAQLDKVISDLAGSTGAAKIFSALKDAGGGYSLSAGTVASQLLALITKHKDHETDPTAAHAATAVSNTPAGNIAATTVQAAVNELDTEKGGLTTANAWSGTNNYSALVTCSGGASFTGGSFSVATGTSAAISDVLNITGATTIDNASLSLTNSSLTVRTHNGTVVANNSHLRVLTYAIQTVGQGAEKMVEIPLGTNEAVVFCALCVAVETSDVSKYAAKIIAGVGYRAGGGAVAGTGYLLGGAGANFVRTSTNIIDDSFYYSVGTNSIAVWFNHNVNSTNYTAGTTMFAVRVKL